MLEAALDADINISLSEASALNVSDGYVYVYPSYTITRNGVEVDISQIFDVYLEEGYIKIEPRILTVESGSGEWIYDGMPHSNNKATIDDSVYYEFIDLGFEIAQKI